MLCKIQWDINLSCLNICFNSKQALINYDALKNRKKTNHSNKPAFSIILNFFFILYYHKSAKMIIIPSLII